MMLTFRDAAKNKYNRYVSPKCIQYLVLIITMCVGIVSTVFAIELNYFDKPITISFKQSELSVVLKEISNNAEVEIIYSEGISNRIVSGQYSDKPLEQLVRLLLRGVNHSLIFDKENKKLWIKDFGEKVYTSTALEGTNIFSKNTVLTSLEMNKVYKQNLAEFENKVSNKNRFLEEVGVTQGELEKRYENYMAKYNDTLSDDNNLIPEVGISHSDFEKYYNDQILEIEKNEGNDASIVPELGITQGELRKDYNEQVEKFNEQEKSGKLFVEDLGMTVGQYERLYSQYVKDFERSLKNQ